LIKPLAGSIIALVAANLNLQLDFASPPVLTLPPRLARQAPRAALILAAMASGYALRSVPDPFPLFGNGQQRVAVDDPLSPTAPVARGDDGGHRFGPALEDGTSGRVPGEFEKQDALLLGVNELIEYHPETLVEIVTAIAGETRIIALISTPEQEEQVLDLLRSQGLSTDSIRFFVWPAASMWVQDFGPRFVVADEPQVVDFDYRISDRAVENQLPMAFAATFGMKIAHCHLMMEGGNCLSNGRGLCITSTTLVDQNRGRGHDLQAVGRLLNRGFGFTKWSYVQPIIGETTGHVDLFLTIGDPNKVFLAAYDAAEDRENADRMDANARVLSEVVAADGRNLEIIRIRQPSARDGSWRSYTNVIYANGVVIVPQFPDFSPELDLEALETYRREFPERRVVGIDSSKIVSKRGGLHCLSLSIPRMPEPPAGQASPR
jgi:agmatine deiminase